MIGRDHLDSGSVASPYRETEAMRDGSDAIADWPILNALLNTAAGATWVSVHHGGGVGIGNSIHAGMVVVADGTDDAAERLERVLTTDPGRGSCATRTRATRKRSRRRASAGCACPRPASSVRRPHRRFTAAAEGRRGRPVEWGHGRREHTQHAARNRIFDALGTTAEVTDPAALSAPSAPSSASWPRSTSPAAASATTPS